MLWDHNWLFRASFPYGRPVAGGARGSRGHAVFLSGGGELPDIVRQGGTGAPAGLGGDALSLAANNEAFSLMADFDFRQSKEVAQLSPIRPDDGFLHAPEEFLLQDQNEEWARHLAADGLVGLVEDRPNIQ